MWCCAKNASGIYKVKKDRLIHLIGELDIKAKTNPLGIANSAAKREAEESLAKLLTEEELKWAQSAKDKGVTEGDSNTQFFHLIANGKHRKKGIVQIAQDEGTIVGHENLKLCYISNYYKKLIVVRVHNFVSLDEN